MTKEQLKSAQWGLAQRVAALIRENKTLRYDQVFEQEFSREETGISGDLAEETRSAVSDILRIFKTRKMRRQSSQEPKEWQLVATKPGRQLSLIDMRSDPD